MNIPEKLATKVMGWKLKKARTTGWGSAPKRTFFVDLTNGHQLILMKGGWDPEHNITQALEIAEKIGGLELIHGKAFVKPKGRWAAYFPKGRTYWGKTAASAITKAAVGLLEDPR